MRARRVLRVHGVRGAGRHGRCVSSSSFFLLSLLPSSSPSTLLLLLLVVVIVLYPSPSRPFLPLAFELSTLTFSSSLAVSQDRDTESLFAGPPQSNVLPILGGLTGAVCQAFLMVRAAALFPSRTVRIAFYVVTTAAILLALTGAALFSAMGFLITQGKLAPLQYFTAEACVPFLLSSSSLSPPRSHLLSDAHLLTHCSPRPLQYLALVVGRSRPPHLARARPHAAPPHRRLQRPHRRRPVAPHHRRAADGRLHVGRQHRRRGGRDGVREEQQRAHLDSRFRLLACVLLSLALSAARSSYD